MLMYHKSDQLDIIEYTDFDFSRYQDSIKSTSCYIYLLAWGAVFWKSTKQSLTASFTIATEFITCYKASNQGIWLWNCITRLHIVNGVNRPLKLFCDNKSVVLSNNNKSSTKTKYINIKFLVVKKRVQSGQLSIKHINTNFMIRIRLLNNCHPKYFISTLLI